MDSAFLYIKQFIVLHFIIRYVIDDPLKSKRVEAIKVTVTVTSHVYLGLSWFPDHKYSLLLDIACAISCLDLTCVLANNNNLHTLAA